MSEDPLFQIIPGYREAVEREAFLRSAAFLPINETVSLKRIVRSFWTRKERVEDFAVEVLPLTPAHFVALDVCGSPFVRGGVPTEKDCAAFLWLTSPHYGPSSHAARNAFLRSLRRVDYASSVAAIHDHIAESFIDAPGHRDGSPVSYWSASASIVDMIASEYHWPEREVLQIPFKPLFQYHRCIKSRHCERPIFHNNLSDAVTARWQESQNAAVTQN